MEVSGETITMNLKDFEELVNEKVEKALSNAGKRVYTAQNVFMSVAISGTDIKTINYSSPFVVNWLEQCKAYKGAVYTKNMFNTSGFGKTYKVSDTTVHEILRKLAVSILGHTTNSDIRYEEYELAIEYYSKFKELWLQLYSERLKTTGSEYFLEENN